MYFSSKLTSDNLGQKGLLSCVAPPGHATQLPHHVTHSQHRQPLTPHETSTTILPPPSCSSAISRFARRLCGMHKFGSSVNSCVCVSFCALAPCRRVRVEQRAPRLSCLEYTYTSRVGVVPRWCRRGKFRALASVNLSRNPRFGGRPRLRDRRGPRTFGGLWQWLDPFQCHR